MVAIFMPASISWAEADFTSSSCLRPESAKSGVTTKCLSQALAGPNTKTSSVGEDNTELDGFISQLKTDSSDIDAATEAVRHLGYAVKMVETSLENLKKWFFDEEYQDARPSILYMIENERYDEIFDSFCMPLKFGTGGRRGLVGIGPNRFNPRTLMESVKGHIDWLFSEYGEDAVKKRGVVLVADVRKYPGYQEKPDWGIFPEDSPLANITSLEFAKIAAEVYVAYGIPVFFVDKPRTTPQLSILVQRLGELIHRKDPHAQEVLNPIAGCVISSSHNQPWYNGIKFYIHTGSQLVPPFDHNLILASEKAIASGKIERIAFNQAAKQDLIDILKGDRLKEIDSACRKIALSFYGYLKPEERDLVIAFDSMNGTGSTWTLPILLEAGYRVRVNPLWLKQDGDFPSAPLQIPNPELPESFNNVMNLAQGSIEESIELKLAAHIKKKDEVISVIKDFEETGLSVAAVIPQQEIADIAMTMDPDADRMGVAFADTNGKWHSFNENNESNLLFAWSKCSLLKKFKPKELEHAYGTSTIVTNPLAGRIMRYFGVRTEFTMPRLTDKEKQDPLFKGIYLPPAGTVINLENFFVGFKNPSNFADLLFVLVKLGKAKGKVIVRIEQGEGGSEEIGAANDKDSAVLLTIADQLSLEKKKGLTPIQVLIQIYKIVGVGGMKVVPIIFEGARGQERMTSIMRGVRDNPPSEMGYFKVAEVIDYQEDRWGGPKRMDTKGDWAKTDKDQRDMVCLDLVVKDNAPAEFQKVRLAKVIKRPSGTEPKHKDFCIVATKPLEEMVSDEEINAQRDAVEAALNLLKRETLKYSYDKAGIWQEISKQQQERFLMLNDYMATGAKLGYLDLERTLWGKASEVTKGDLTQDAFNNWFKQELRKIGIKGSITILAGKALESFLDEKAKATDDTETARVIYSAIWPDKENTKGKSSSAGERVAINLAISIGGHKIAVNLVDSSGKLLLDRSIDIKWREELGISPDTEGFWESENSDRFLQLIMKSVNSAIDAVEGINANSIKEVGIAFAGPVDSGTGIAGTPFAAPNTPFQNYPIVEKLKALLSHRFGLDDMDIELLNDCGAAMKGELSVKGGLHEYGSGSVMIIGGGINITSASGNEIYYGRYNEIREIGHNLVPTDILPAGYTRSQGSYTYTGVSTRGDHPKDFMGKNLYGDFEDRCSGPNLASRFAYDLIQLTAKSNPDARLFNGLLAQRIDIDFKDTDEFLSILVREGSLTENEERLRSKAVDIFLVAITDAAKSDISLAKDWIAKAGDEIGRALAAFIAYYYGEDFIRNIILVSGVNENLGKGVKDETTEDLYVKAIREAVYDELTRFYNIESKDATMLARGIERSKLTYEREFIAFTPVSVKSSSSGTELSEIDNENIRLAAEAAKLSTAKGTVAYDDTTLSSSQQQALQSLIGVGTQGLAGLEDKLGCKVRLLSQGSVEDDSNTIIISSQQSTVYTKAKHLIVEQTQVDLQDKAVYIAVFSHIPIAKGLLGLKNKTEQPGLYAALKQSIRSLSQRLLNNEEIEAAIDAYLSGNPMFIKLPPVVSYEGRIEDVQRVALMALIAA